ncbi:MAG: hypothetical protein Q8O84_03065 [Nanoarchaeota archaeon]|nr:hypothetical protein [Nanoarchaeota archaeon]
MKNLLENLFEEFNNRGISYCVRSKYKHLPKSLDNGDIDMLLEKKDFLKFIEIIKKFKFKFYPYTKPNFFYFIYDKNLGLIHLDVILIKKMISIKKYKNFYIPANEKSIPNRKTFLQKIKTGLRRRIYWLFNGPVIVFEGPDGSGKSTLTNAVYTILEKFPIKKEIIHFATHFNGNKKPSKLKRALTRAFSILKVWKNKILGKISITDRYIYLTFRKHRQIFGKILKFLAPKPDIVFVMKSSPEEIRKRKIGQRDLLSNDMIKELYKVYDSIPGKIDINTKKPKKENLEFMVNKILEKILI